MKEKRNQQVKFWASNAEIQIIQRRKESAGFRCLGAYLRKMAMDGYIIVIDLTDEETLAKYFKLHLERGIAHLSGTNFIKSLDDLVHLATGEE